MTAKETARLLAWLKEKGYTLDEINRIFQYIAFGKKPESN